jgi:hypothetical protein
VAVPREYADLMQLSKPSHRWVVALAGAALLLAVSGCTAVLPVATSSSGASESPGASATPHSSSSALILTTEQGWTFTRPASWKVVEPINVVRPGPLFFLTNAATGSGCASGSGMSCLPVSALPAGGVLIVFAQGAVFLPNEDQNAPVHAVKQDPYCDQAVPDEVLAARIGGTDITACLRGPDLSGSEAGFKALVASISNVK